MTQAEALEVLKMGENVFLTGAPGAGKTYVLNQYIAYLREQEVPVAVTAYTGIAASHIFGRTLHSFAGLVPGRVLSPAEETVRVRSSKYYMETIGSRSVLIIDEVSMLHPEEFDRVDLICQAARGSSLPFGGMQVVCCGDFFQIPPVNAAGRFVIDSAAWKNCGFRVCYLLEQHRQGDAELLRVLDDIRGGVVSSSTIALLEGRRGRPVASPVGLARLYTHREDVDAINLEQLSKLPGDEVIYEVFENGTKSLVDRLKKDNSVGKIVLKIGARVMFTKNNTGMGYVNGTLGEVMGFVQGGDAVDGATSFEANPVVRTFEGREIVAGRESWRVEDDGKVRASITQLPLKLAWAITIHKSQGMTLDAAEIDLGKAFDRGMGYVALSRVRELRHISLIDFNEVALMVSPRIQGLDKEFLAESRDSAEYLSGLSEDERMLVRREFLERASERGSGRVSGADDTHIDYSEADDISSVEF